MGWVIGHGNSFIFRQGGGNKWSSYWSTRTVTGLTATTVSNTGIDLAWTNNGDTDYTGHKVYYSTDNITFSLLDTVASIGTNYSATGLDTALTYYFYVKPYKDTNEGNASNTADNSAYIFSFNSIQPATINQMVIRLNVDTGKKLYLDWGNGSTVTITADGSDQNITSVYVTNNTTYNIKIFGELQFLRKFYLVNEATASSITTLQVAKLTGLTYWALENSGTDHVIDSSAFVGMALTRWSILASGTGHHIDSADFADITTLTTFHLTYAGTNNFVDSAHFVNKPNLIEFDLVNIIGSTLDIDSSDFAGKDLIFFKIFNAGTYGTNPVAYHIDSSDFIGMPLEQLSLYAMGASADVVIDSADLSGITQLYVLNHQNSGNASSYTVSDLTNMAANGLVTLTNIGTVGGNLSDFHATMTMIHIQGCGKTMSLTTGALKAWNAANISLLPSGTAGTGYSTAEIDAFLIAYAAVAGAGTKTVDLRGSNQVRSSSSDAAVATLQGLGRTVYTTP